MDTIAEVGLRIGRQFNPERVILFGSHAEGRADADSDVDLPVIMPTKWDPVDESVAIRFTYHDQRGILPARRLPASRLPRRSASRTAPRASPLTACRHSGERAV
jgi:hypothetical protein